MGPCHGGSLWPVKFLFSFFCPINCCERGGGSSLAIGSVCPCFNGDCVGRWCARASRTLIRRRHSCLCFNICCPQILLSNIKSVGQLLVANHVGAMHNERRVMSMNLLLARLPNTAVLAITLAGPMETLWIAGRTLAASPSCQLHELFSFLSFVTKKDFDGVVTCIPLYEPVEAYSFLGFPLGWRSRRDGSADHICKTCYRCFEVPRNGPRKAFPCGHDKSKVLCQMCYLMSCVLHPHPGEFAYGHSKN